ncbi:MAG: thioredoxin family protein [Pseudomonadota bacterium]
MLNDDNLSLYAYALILSGVMLGASFFAADPKIEVAAIEREQIIDYAGIETASIPQASEEREWGAPDIPWKSYDLGMEEVSRTGKPALMVLHADWCRVCKSYQTLFKQPSVTRFNDDFVFVLVDVDQEPHIQRRYNVDGDYVPRTMVLNAPGELATGQTGAHPRQRFFVDPYDERELTDLLDDVAAGAN